MSKNDFIIQRIFSDMSEGVISIDMQGKISMINPSALELLEKEEDELVGFPFASCFFEYEENDKFNQTILDAIYDADSIHESIVDYFTGSVTKQLHITTSYLKDDGNKIGVVAVMSDVTELSELRDAVKAMEKIKALNNKLELRNKLLSETFGRFLSDDIVKQLLDTPDGLKLGGKKAHLTVLMSDLRGFTALSERMPAVDLLTMLNHYLGAMTEIIQSNSGTIIEFIGDGIMAIFGAPVESNIHAFQCVKAAVEMQMKMAEINAWNRENNYPDLEMGIGINTGDVIVGNIGSEKRTKYGITGSNVNLAGRIESYTVGGQVLISEFTRECIKEELIIESEQSVKPKGVDKPITLSSVAGIGGEYDIKIERDIKEPIKLEKTVEVSFITISGKHGMDTVFKGKFTALSQDQGIFVTDAELNDHDNVQIEIDGEKLFAKVVEKNSDSLKLRFTSRPAHFNDWLKKSK